MNRFKQQLTSLSIPLRLLLALCVGIGVIGIWARVYNLGWPAKQVFDEVYFPVFAKNYLDRVSVFDVHPPLGKFIIAVAIAVFGDQPFAWRIMPSLIGIALPFTAGIAWWRYSKDLVGSLIMGLFLAVEPILIVYSRTGLLDGMQLFFILLAFGCAAGIKQKKQLVMLAVIIGLAVSIKWVALGVVVPIAYILWRKGYVKEFIASLSISLVIYLVIVWVGQVLNQVDNPWAGVIEWHRQAYYYHLHLTATHPWSSMWWSWPFMLRPVLFFYETTSTGLIEVISAIGNPIVWLASTLAVGVSLIEVIRVWIQERSKFLDHKLVPLLIGYAACYVPWIPIHRVVFLYHYLPAYAFALFMLVYWLRKAWDRSPIIVFIFITIGVGVGIFYLPMAMGLPMTQQALQSHLWLKSWL